MLDATPRKRPLWRWLPLLVIVCTIACGLILTRHGAPGFDRSALLWFRTPGDGSRLAGPGWVTAFWVGVSWLGDVAPRVTVAAVTVLALLYLRRWRSAAFITGLLLSGIALSTLIKHWVGRPRPDLVVHLDQVSSASFPSGHALNSTLFYLGVAMLVAQFMHRRGQRWALYALASGLSLAIGISRVVLGVHYPSDVIASWAISAAWLWLWFGAAAYYRPKAIR